MRAFDIPDPVNLPPGGGGGEQVVRKIWDLIGSIIFGTDNPVAWRNEYIWR